MSIQKYFCTSNHTILPKGSNFHSTCITNLLNSCLWWSSLEWTIELQWVITSDLGDCIGEPSFFACHSNTHSIIKSPSFLWFKVFNNYTKYRKVTG